MSKFERIIPDYAQVSAETRIAIDPHIAGAQISKISTKQAHGVVETTVVYLRGSVIHQIIYDETTKKLLGGNDPQVIELVIGVLPPSAQQAVRAGGQAISQIKIKHDESDDREYVHAHYAASDGQILSAKFELDGSDKDKNKNKAPEIERRIDSYDQLAPEVRAAFDPHIQGAQISGIVQAEAHGVVEIAISYLRGSTVHEIIYDATTKKLLGGSEAAVIDRVIAMLPESGQRVVREGGTSIRKLKIKHDEDDDREYVHVHYGTAQGEAFSRKLELDGRAKGKVA